MCQAISFLYLESIAQSELNKPSDSLSESDFSSWKESERLRAYFKYQISTNSNPIYGDGFRTAQKCISELGLQVVIDHITNEKSFPVI
jgi:hypothetical protein